MSIIETKNGMTKKLDISTGFKAISSMIIFPAVNILKRSKVSMGIKTMDKIAERRGCKRETKSMKTTASMEIQGPGKMKNDSTMPLGNGIKFGAIISRKTQFKFTKNLSSTAKISASR